MTFQGLEVLDVEVQVQIASAALPSFSIVGLPDKAVSESRDRVRGALHALGLSLPAKRLTVNLAPGDLSKEGSHFDLPVALGILGALEVAPKDALERYYALGELGLDGRIRAVPGTLPAAIHAAERGKGLICPEATGEEAAWAGEELDIAAAPDLLALLNHLKGQQGLTRPRVNPGTAAIANPPDLADIRGQETAKRALEIAAAGEHNMLMCGPPGSGKSMLAARLPGILPPLSAAEALEVSMIHSLAGTLPEGGLVRTRPYRDPHHSASLPALIGGGQKVRPGEASLAHRGVLFLDELPEFARPTLEALRQPMETRQILVSRVNSRAVYPARFQLIAAMNPCRCGYLDDPARACTRAPKCAADYQSKISGPLFDRIDLHIDVAAVPFADLSAPRNGESTGTVAARVEDARKAQQDRLAQMGRAEIGSNAMAQDQVLEEIAPLSTEARALLNRAAESLNLSARGYHRLLRVARTIADLDGAPPEIAQPHLAEALSYRRAAYTAG